MFERSQNVKTNWSFNRNIPGTWSFNYYVPLPPPVSFIGINFGISVSFSININLGANAVTSAGSFSCTFLVNVGTALKVEASAALRVVAVEGGVYIKGTLVSVRTDPKLILEFKTTAPKSLKVTIDWKFYLTAFQFKWGFFWRYRKLKGWSDKKAIAEYTITNGIERTFPVLNWSRFFYF